MNKSDSLSHLTIYRTCGTMVINHSLVSMAQEARKPMFDLKPADGALGAFSAATHDVYKDFKRLAEKLIERAGVVKRF